MEIKAEGVTDLYLETLWWAKNADHYIEDTRAGKARVLREPLTIINHTPQRRVLFNANRNANPFFQLMECIWMFAGSNSDWIVQFNRRMKDFMDYGRFHGAYGNRWVNHFNVDQILEVIRMLKNTPNTRRAYLSIWDPNADLNIDYKDLPCNVGMAFQMRDGVLNGYVFNRSNDIIWGMLGTNCVHFSMLLELVSSLAGIPLGSLYQISINPHIYERHWPLMESPYDGMWTQGVPEPVGLNPLSYESWARDSRLFLELDSKGTYENWWFRAVAAPMYEIYIHANHKALANVAALDWRGAAAMWLGINRGVIV